MTEDTPKSALKELLNDILDRLERQGKTMKNYHDHILAAEARITILERQVNEGFASALQPKEKK